MSKRAKFAKTLLFKKKQFQTDKEHFVSTEIIERCNKISIENDWDISLSLILRTTEQAKIKKKTKNLHEIGVLVI